jgi:hypothetical protein
MQRNISTFAGPAAAMSHRCLVLSTFELSICYCAAHGGRPYFGLSECTLSLSGFLYAIAFHPGWLGCSVRTLPSFSFSFFATSPSLAFSGLTLSCVPRPLPPSPVPAVPNACLLASISCQAANCLDRGTTLRDGENTNEGLACMFLHVSACP